MVTCRQGDDNSCWWRRDETDRNGGGAPTREAKVRNAGPEWARVIDAAEALARTLGESDNHTVAAAAMDIDGNIHQAVNVYHFNGGPCAELVALGVAASAGANNCSRLQRLATGGAVLSPRADDAGRCSLITIPTYWSQCRQNPVRSSGPFANSCLTPTSSQMLMGDELFDSTSGITTP